METAFPDYHEQDRIAIVSLVWEEAFSHTAVAVTAFTALFYDAMRRHQKPFFNYPSHYLFMNHKDGQPITRQGPVSLNRPLTDSWTWLDVWPETQWIFASMECGELLRLVFSQHIHRLFFPEALLKRSSPVEPIPDYMRWILSSRLKEVYVYGSTSPNLRIEIAPEAASLVAKAAGFQVDTPAPGVSDLEVLDSDIFFERLLGPGPQLPRNGE